MKRKLLMKSIIVMAFSSFLIGTLSPALTYANNDVNPRKSAWTEETAPKEEVLQIPAQNQSSEKTQKPSVTHAKNNYINDRIIVKYKKGFSSLSSAAIAANRIQNRVKLGSIDAEVMQLTPSTDVQQLIAELNKDPNVQYAEPDRKVYPASLPNDPYFPKQWGLHNTGQIVPYNFNNPYQEGREGLVGLDIKAPEAWEITKGSSDVVIAVIDTGIASNHLDLKDSIWTNSKEIPGNQKDDDGNGYIDDVSGWNFFGNNNQIYSELDGDLHGTVIGGIIAASNNNETGISGIAPNVKLMPLKFIGPETGAVSDIIKAIAYAENKGVKIANLSIEMEEYSQALKDAIDASSMLFITAAGNGGYNNDSYPAYPSSYDSPNIVSVTSVTNEGQLSAIGNYGFKSVDVAAPGDAIVTTIPTNNPGFGAEIYDPALNDKVVFNGIGFEYIPNGQEDDEEDEGFAASKDSFNYRQDVFDRAMEYLGVSKFNADSKILLVQDDLSNMSPIASANRLPIYEELLKDYAGTITHVQAAVNGGDGPTAEVMKNYDAVIWFTGMADRLSVSNLTTEDQKQLTEYLTKVSGHILFSGNNVLNGYDEKGGTNGESSIVESDFVKNVLHFQWVEQHDYSYAEGLPDTIYANMKYPLEEDRDSYNVILSRDPSITKINLNHTNSDFYESNYEILSGTSIAAAHASGVAALVLSQDPSLSAVAIKQRIINSGTRLSSLTGFVASGRMINAYKALTDDDIPGTPFFGESVTNQLNDKSDANDVYSLELNAGDNVNISLTGDNGTDFDLLLYPPDAKTIYTSGNLLAYSENLDTSTETITYKVTTSGTYYVNVYAYKGSGSYTLTVKTDNQIGGYEESSPSLVFIGPWSTLNDSAFSGRSAKQINEKGKVEFSFQGNYFSWIGLKNENQGIADVFFDGVKVASPSLYSPTALSKQVIFEKLFPYGQHTISIEWTGKLDPEAKKSGTAFLNVDAFTVANFVEDDDYSGSFNVPWFTNISSKHLGGMARYSELADSTAQYQFEGKKVQLIAYTGPNRGKANIYIDDNLVTPVPVDMYSATTKYRAVVFESALLSPGVHTIKIVNTGQKNAASSGTFVSFDAISIIQ